MLTVGIFKYTETIIKIMQNEINKAELIFERINKEATQQHKGKIVQKDG